MEIRLLELRLENFKGLKSFVLTPNGKDANVSGDNATGKTTLKDAWSWLLFDKDSANRSDFSIKTLDRTGLPIHFMEHSVEGILQVNGNFLTLKKMLKEKWVKKRGQEDQEFSGHETFYWINEVPSKASEYKAQISSLIDEKVFPLITDPFYFNNIMKWNDRRNTLVQIAGDVSDEDVIASNEKLAKLPAILESRTMEQHDTLLKERIKKTKDEMQGIPPRIDELMRSLPETDPDYSTYEAEVNELNKALAEVERKLTQASSFAQDRMKLQQELISAQSKLNDIKAKIEKDANAGVRALTDEKHNLDNTKYKLDMEINSLTSKISDLQGSIKTNEFVLEDLRKQFDEEDAKLFPEPSIDTVCPTCGQAIPETHIHSQYETMRKQFEDAKNKRLDDIEAKGLNAKERHMGLHEDLRKFQKDIADKQEQLNEIIPQIADIEKKIAGTSINLDYGRNAEYCTVENKIAELKREIEKPVEDTSSELLDTKSDLTQRIDTLKKILASKDKDDATRNRIEQLKDEEKQLAKKLAEYEGQKFLMETFIKSKVDLIEGKINSLFKHVTFKLFDTQINGAITPCCETLIKGVPWNDANHEGRTNGGLDIINTLSKYYDVKAPIFNDYSESVNKLIPVESQLIRLIVTKDKSLKVEVED